MVKEIQGIKSAVESCTPKLSSLIQRHIEGDGILIGVEKDVLMAF